MNGYDVTIKLMLKFADEFRIKNVKKMIDEMIEAKYTLLKYYELNSLMHLEVTGYIKKFRI